MKMIAFSATTIRSQLILVGLLILLTKPVFGFTYVAAGQAAGPDTVVHPIGYSGKGGVLEISVGLDPKYSYLEDDIRFSATQAVAVWNNLVPTTRNLTPSAEIPRRGGVDVMGVLIHELGHSLGLAHPNQGGAQFGNSAKALSGPDRKMDCHPGEDGIVGSGDDQRGDDVSLNYFHVRSNNPFVLPSDGVIDCSSYSRDLERLPESDSYSAIAHRLVAGKIHNLRNTIAIMVGGGSQIPGLVRRSLSADDVAGIRYAMSGLDGKQGTKDDYSINMRYVGISDSADVVIRFDKPDANASTGVSTLAAKVKNHRVMRTGRPIRYNPNLSNGRTWYFPVLQPMAVEMTEKEPNNSHLRIATVRGKRYAIAMPEKGIRADRLSISYNGNPLPHTGADYLFFIARTEVSELDVLMDTSFPVTSVRVFQVDAKPLRMD